MLLSVIYDDNTDVIGQRVAMFTNSLVFRQLQLLFANIMGKGEKRVTEVSSIVS